MKTGKVYQVGDYYNDGIREGVVFEVSADGRHGKIVSMKYSSEKLQWASDKFDKRRFIGADSENDGEWNMTVVKTINDWHSKYPAFAWCADLGESWYLPSIEELNILLLNDAVRYVVNNTLLAEGGERLGKSPWYWSSTECDEHYACNIFMYTRSTGETSKGYSTYVRAVSTFGYSSESVMAKVSTRKTFAPYKVGDYYNENGKEGVVFEVSTGGLHGKIVSMTQSAERLEWSSDTNEQCRLIGANSETYGAYNILRVKHIVGWKGKYPAFAWCDDLGEGWYLPSIEELKNLMLDTTIREVVRKTLFAEGGAMFNRDWYWSSTEAHRIPKEPVLGYYCMWNVCLYDGSVGIDYKSNYCYVRAVSTF